MIKYILLLLFVASQAQQKGSLCILGGSQNGVGETTRVICSDGGDWTDAAAMPLGVRGGIAVYLSGKPCYVGGHAKDGRRLKNTVCYDKATNTWSAMADLNSGRYYPHLVYIDGKPCMAGGQDKVGSNADRDANGARYSPFGLDTVECWDNGSWVVQAAKLTHKRIGGISLVIKGMQCLIGTYGNWDFMDKAVRHQVDCYKNGAWSVNEVPEAIFTGDRLEYAESGIINGHPCVVGGYGSGYIKDVTCFDEANNRWDRDLVPDMKSARDLLAVMSFDDGAYCSITARAGRQTECFDGTSWSNTGHGFPVWPVAKADMSIVQAQALIMEVPSMNAPFTAKAIGGSAGGSSGSTGQKTSVKAGICLDHVNDYSAADKPASVSDWADDGRHGWRTCDKLSNDECNTLCDNLAGCKHFSNDPTNCCFPFKNDGCDVSGNSASILSRYKHYSVGAVAPPKTACDIDGCFARCEKIYGAGDPSYMCKKGCADMEAGQVKDRNLVCNTNLEATTYSNCLTRCSQPNRISSVPANRAKCANGCEFWNKPVAAAAARCLQWGHRNCVGSTSAKCNIGSPYDPRRWKATLQEAKTFCDQDAECFGITKDNGGYEPRRGPDIRYHVAAKEMWTCIAVGASAMAACPVSFTASLQSACSCEGEATECSVGQFCYGGGCKGQAQCPVRQDVDKNLFYGAKVYGNWNASTKIMSMNFTTPWDVSVQSMTWKNAASDQLKYTSASMGLWKKDTSNACAPTYKLDVPQTTFFGAGSKFNIRGSQLSTTMRVVASETVTTVKNGQTYTYNRNIKNTVPILVNLVTKTTIAVRFRSTIAEPGPGPAPKLEDFVLFIGAEDNFADADPNVLITMQVHSRACIDNTGNSKGVAVTTGLDNIAPGKASEFTWKTDSNGNIEKSYEHNLCVETLMWKFVPKQYRENTYEISLEFTLRGTGEKFTSIAAIDIKQGDVLSDIGFTTDIKTYDDEGCTTENNKFILGQKFYTKISLSDLIVNTNNITCNTYKIKQTKNGVTTTTDLKAEVKYAFMEKKSALNTHICGAELESHHFHISVDGYDTLLETEILITYDQTNTRRKLIQVPFTEEMFDAAGYDLTNEWALGDGIELSDEDLAFQNTKRAPDTDDMVVEMFIEADKAVGTLFTEESMNTFKNLFMMATVLGCAGFVFGYVSNKFKSDDYVALIEMQNE